MKDDPAWLRREGRRLVAKGQAMLDRADHVEAAQALGEEPRPLSSEPGVPYGLVATAEEMGEAGWFTAQAMAERANRDVRSCASCLSRLVKLDRLETRKQQGFPAEYRSKGHG